MIGRGFFARLSDVDEGGLISLASLRELVPTMRRLVSDEDDAAFSHAKEAGPNGKVSELLTGLIVRGGVIGCNTALGPFLTLDTAGLFLIGSPSPLCSNNDMRAFVGPIGLKSVVILGPITVPTVLFSPTFGFRRSAATCFVVVVCVEGPAFELGLDDRLAASVAAMRDWERESPVVGLVGARRELFWSRPKVLLPPVVCRLEGGERVRLRSRDAEVAARRAPSPRPLRTSRFGVNAGAEPPAAVGLVGVFWKARKAPLKAVLYVVSSWPVWFGVPALFMRLI